MIRGLFGNIDAFVDRGLEKRKKNSRLICSKMNEALTVLLPLHQLVSLNVSSFEQPDKQVLNFFQTLIVLQNEEQKYEK
ncbi:hypothetical protein M5689_016815 [Euphorbia peplus]|nr:hypothetical protein M5689_016815 [Euphorbia peplus]